MLYCEHESLFTRSAAACAASGGSRNNPSRDCQNVRGLVLDDQALCQTTTRKRSCLAQSDPRSASTERSRLAGEPERAVRKPCRCHARRALPALRSQIWSAGESRQHQSCPSGSGLDTKKKTLRASEQDEAARAAWREQARHLVSQDLVFVDAHGFAYCHDSLVCLCSPRTASHWEGSPQLWSKHDVACFLVGTGHGRSAHPRWSR